MSHNIFDHPFSDVMNKMAEKLTPSLPPFSLYKDTKVKLGAGVGFVEGREVVQFSVNFEMTEKDMNRYLFPTDQERIETAKDTPIMTFIGAEKVMNGLYIIIHPSKKVMLKKKFETKVEARSYISLVEAKFSSKLTMLKPEEWKIVKSYQSFSEDSWHEGTIESSPSQSKHWRFIGNIA